MDANRHITLPNELVSLLISARGDYCWPGGTTRFESQKVVMDLEAEVQLWMDSSGAEEAWSIVQRVSKWGGNNVTSQSQIARADASTKQAMKEAIQRLNDTETLEKGLRALCDLPGINLVMASKIYRFCVPDLGAALDRHSSYFFNSLCRVSEDGTTATATAFPKAWTTARRNISRLAIYSQTRFERVLSEYLTVYLPLLRDIASSLNLHQNHYKSAVDNRSKDWRPADVEMAAYNWWAQQGPR